MARNPFTRRLPGGRIVANHLPGGHDQQTHGGGRGGTATVPKHDPEKMRIAGGEWSRHSGGYIGAAVILKDGSLYAHPDGHYQAMTMAFKEGRKPSDIVEAGEFYRDTKKFESLGEWSDHYRYIRDGAWKDFQQEESGWSLDHLEGQHDQKTHGGGGGGGKEKSRVVGPTRPMMKGYMYSAVRMKDGTIYLPAGRGDETGTHYDALRRAFKDGYTRNDVAGFAYMTDKKLTAVDKEYSGFYRTILDTASVDHLREKEGFSLDSKRVWPLRSTHHTPGGHEHDQKTHGGGGGGGNFVQKGGLEFTKAESRTYRLPGTGQKIDPKDIVGSSSGIYPAAVRMRDGSLILGSSHYSIFTGHVFPKGYKPTDVRSYGYYNREDGEFFPLLDDDSAHAGAIIDDAWKDHQNTGWSLDKRIWPLRSTQHTPGGHEHDQKSHGGGGGGDSPPFADAQKVQGIWLSKSQGVIYGAAIKKSDVKYHDSGNNLERMGAAVWMKDGSVHVDWGHDKVLPKVFKQGYTRADIYSVGVYYGQGESRFEPYPAQEFGHVEAQIEFGEDQAKRESEGSGWSLDHRATHHGDHDQKTHGNRQGVGGKPDDHGTKIVGGLELRKGWDVRQPVDKSKVTGYTSAMYASVQAVRMKDGSVHASDNGHAQAMYEMMRKGYKRDDFQSVGFYLPKKSAFEPYHVNDIGHIKYMMDHAEQRARTMDLSGWSLDRRDK